MKLSEWYASGGHVLKAEVGEIPNPPSIGLQGAFALAGMPVAKADQMMSAYNPERRLKSKGMAGGGQAFPLQDPEEEKRRRAIEGSDMRVPQKYPTFVKLGEGVKGIHEFVSKPFGYENPPGEMLSGLLGLPAIGQTLEDIGYDMPLIRGAGVTTTVRPEVSEALLTGLPVAGKAAQIGAKAGAKVLPKIDEVIRAADIPVGMSIKPVGEAPIGKVKAPANEVGFYNPAEKAALNVQRKKGTGDAFLADLKKQPGVNDERLAELGLDQFKGKPNVTREEIIAAAQERRIPLQESVKRELDENAISELEDRYDDIRSYMAEAYANGDRYAFSNYEREMADNLAEQKRLKSFDEARFSPSAFPDYNMPGGTDYREIRVKLPPTKNNPIPSDKSAATMLFENKMMEKYGGENFPSVYQKLTPDEVEKYEMYVREDANSRKTQSLIQDKENNFRHQQHHGEEPNVLFHLRVANHADADGKKGLLIDELQSDWHQQGSKKGYGYVRGYRVIEPSGQLFGEYASKAEAENALARAKSGSVVEQSDQMYKGVPDAPFKNNWYQLGLKRAIKEAADTGMDRVYLTTGKRQIDRYEEELRKNVDAIEYEPFRGENGELMFEISGIKNGKEVVNKDNLTYKELEELVGKDMADKMKNNAGESLAKERPNRPDWMRLSGDDLSIGGEGMKQWYDKTYKNYLEKYAKQHGSKLGMTKLKTSKDGDDLFEVVLPNGKIVASRPNKKQAEATAASFNGAEVREIDHSEPVYYIDITPQMKESAKKGQSYKRGGEVKRPTTLSDWYRSGKHLPH